MRTYSSPRRGYCASCETLLTSRPVYRMDETYCCAGCAQGGPCVCTYEADLAEDGVDHLGLPFRMDLGRVEASASEAEADRVAPEVR